MDVDMRKRVAAEYASGLVEDGMVVGLGSGSTAELAVQALGLRVREGLKIVGVATSRSTERLARTFFIKLSRLDELLVLDITIDGSDEVDPNLNLVKGRGGALLREKLVADAANRFVVVVDDDKLVTRLGERAPIPVEIVPFGWTSTRHRLEMIGLSCELRRQDGHVYMTSNHNYILDCHADAALDLSDPATGDRIKAQTGVVEHGLFLGMTAMVAVGKADGTVDVMMPPSR